MIPTKARPMAHHNNLNAKSRKTLASYIKYVIEQPPRCALLLSIKKNKHNTLISLKPALPNAVKHIKEFRAAREDYRSW